MTTLNPNTSQFPEEPAVSPFQPSRPTPNTHTGLNVDSIQFDRSNETEAKISRRQARFTKTKNEVENLRDAILRCRLTLRESRQRLGRHRSQVQQMEGQLLKEFQNPWEQITEAGRVHMNHLYEEILKASDELGPGEEDFREKEDDLSVMEYKLGKLENRLYSYLKTATIGINSPMASIGSSSDDSSAPSPGTSVLLGEDESSPMHRYLSRVGDANILRERLAELEFEKSQYVGQEEERSALGIPLYQPNVDFLAAFDRVYGQQLNELHSVEEDLAILGHEAGLIYPLTSENAELNDQPTTPHSYDDQRNHRSRFGDNSLRRKSDGDLFGVPNDPRTARQRVNEWILDMLVDSSIERARHKAILDDPFLGHEEWLALILEYWPKDRFAISADVSPQNTSTITRSSENLYAEMPSAGSFQQSSPHTVKRFLDFGPSAETDLIPSGLDTETFLI